ncbi:MAG: dihydrofolate reductase family protein [Thermoplasmata archaeon]|nr:dihydrofolate reductase family protein [Thermoplasmata archaeon]
MPTTDRPEVLVNCAISADGRLAYAGGRQAKLSGPNDLARVQWLRADVDGILVGVGTVVADDPSLRVHWERIDRPKGRSPTRVIVDSLGRTPPEARVLDGSTPTVVAVTDRCTRTFPPHVEVIRVGSGRVDLPQLFTELKHRGMRKLLVEGGGEILASVLAGGLFDRMTVFVAPTVIGGSTAPPMVRGPDLPESRPSAPLVLVTSEPLDDGVVLTYVPAGNPNAPARQLSGPTHPDGSRAEP